MKISLHPSHRNLVDLVEALSSYNANWVHALENYQGVETYGRLKFGLQDLTITSNS